MLHAKDSLNALNYPKNAKMIFLCMSRYTKARYFAYPKYRDDVLQRQKLVSFKRENYARKIAKTLKPTAVFAQSIIELSSRLSSFADGKTAIIAPNARASESVFIVSEMLKQVKWLCATDLPIIFIDYSFYMET